MSALDEVLKKHRQRIIDREERAVRELLDAYAVIERELRRSIADLARKIAEAKAAGVEISPTWLQRERRLAILVDQVKDQIARFGSTATAVTMREQRAAIEIALRQTNETFALLTGIDPSSPNALGTQLNPRFIEDAVGMMGDGSPIIEYYRQTLAPKVAEAIRVEVIKGVATGTDFRTIADRLLRTGQITKSRALATARTEVNRVRRETTRAIYQDNSDIVSGWEWVASKSRRTCPACLAQDGKVYRLDDEFPQHINCRCTLIPVIIGLPRRPRTLGRDWFDQQPIAIKEEILGKEAADAYVRGEVGLGDFVGWATDKFFGNCVYTRKLSDALRHSISDFVTQVEGALRSAGFNTERKSARSTNSIYLVIEKMGKQTKIRISDHDPSNPRNLLDLRPGTTMPMMEIIKAVKRKLT